LKVWPQMRLDERDPSFAAIGGAGEQVCSGDLIRFRTISGICNDIFNPRMGSTGMAFARNVEFESTFPELGHDRLAANRHGDRLSLLQPDPQLISRVLLSREQSRPEACNQGL